MLTVDCDSDDYVCNVGLVVIYSRLVLGDKDNLAVIAVGAADYDEICSGGIPEAGSPLRIKSGSPRNVKCAGWS